MYNTYIYIASAKPEQFPSHTSRSVCPLSIFSPRRHSPFLPHIPTYITLFHLLETHLTYPLFLSVIETYTYTPSHNTLYKTQTFGFLACETTHQTQICCPTSSIYIYMYIHIALELCMPLTMHS